MPDLTNVSLELWIDEHKSKVLNEGYFRTLHDLEVDAISVMIDPETRAWDPKWNAKDIEALLKLADPYCMEVILTTWPFPDKAQLDAMKDDMMELIHIGCISAWEVDVEFNWKPDMISGFHSQVIKGVRRSAIDLAGDYLVQVMDDVTTHDGQFEPGQIRKELTTFSQHVENGRAADVAPHMDRLKVQAYSVRKRKNPDKSEFLVPWDHTYGPGNMQRFTLDRTMMVPRFGSNNQLPEIGYGMALWNQTWPGHTPAEAMTKALEAALQYPIVCVCGWSSKHVFGPDKNPYALPWLDSLREEV